MSRRGTKLFHLEPLGAIEDSAEIPCHHESAGKQQAALATSILEAKQSFEAMIERKKKVLWLVSLLTFVYLLNVAKRITYAYELVSQLSKMKDISVKSSRRKEE